MKQILFILVAVVGLTLGISAQKGGGGQKPPKDPPPKIEPKPKNDPPPKGGNRPGKPGMAFLVARLDENKTAD